MPLSFSLRTLMIIITALGVWLGCEVNWIRQRHTFLAEQFSRHLEKLARSGEERQNDPNVVNWWKRQLATQKRAPNLLWMFGESGVGRLWIVVPARDVNLRHWGTDALGSFEWYDVSASQPDYQRAKRLFPEAVVTPVRPNDSVAIRTGLGIFIGEAYEVTVGDQSKPLPGLHLICDSTVEESSTFTGQFKLEAPLDGAVLVRYLPYDGTTISPPKEVGTYDVSVVQIPPGETTVQFKIIIAPLSEAARAAGGAEFKVKIGVVAGAVPEVKEKTIKVIPSPP